jgi:hypothetical protein
LQQGSNSVVEYPLLAMVQMALAQKCQGTGSTLDVVLEELQRDVWETFPDRASVQGSLVVPLSWDGANGSLL